jgi:hypothetical protein
MSNNDSADSSKARHLIPTYKTKILCGNINPHAVSHTSKHCFQEGERMRKRSLIFLLMSLFLVSCESSNTPEVTDKAPIVGDESTTGGENTGGSTTTGDTSTGGTTTGGTTTGGTTTGGTTTGGTTTGGTTTGGTTTGGTTTGGTTTGGTTTGGTTTGGTTTGGTTTGGTTTGGTTTGGTTTGGTTTGGTTTGGTTSTLPAKALSFKTNITLIGFDSTRATKMRRAIEVVRLVVGTEEFRKRVLDHTWNGVKTYVDNRGHSNLTIYNNILDGGESLQPTKNNTMDMEVELYYANNSTVGYTYPNTRRIWVNQKFFDQYNVASVANNLMHEWLHKLGYDHAQTWSTSRDFSVPYGVGRIVGQVGLKFL